MIIDHLTFLLLRLMGVHEIIKWKKYKKFRWHNTFLQIYIYIYI